MCVCVFTSVAGSFGRTALFYEAAVLIKNIKTIYKCIKWRAAEKRVAASAFSVQLPRPCWNVSEDADSVSQDGS